MDSRGTMTPRFHHSSAHDQFPAEQTLTDADLMSLTPRPRRRSHRYQRHSQAAAFDTCLRMRRRTSTVA